MYSIRSCMCSPESNIHYWQAPRASCPGPWCPPTSQPSSAAPSRGIGIGWALGEAFALFLSFSSFIKELPQIFTHAGSSCLTFRSFARRPYLMKCFLKQSSHLQRNQLLEEKSMTMLTTTQKCIWKSPFFSEILLTSSFVRGWAGPAGPHFAQYQLIKSPLGPHFERKVRAS